MKKIIIYCIVFSLIYVLLVIFTGIYFLSWGQKRTLFEKLCLWFLTKPFSLEISFGFVIFNSLFWFVCIFLIYKIITMLKQILFEKRTKPLFQKGQKKE